MAVQHQKYNRLDLVVLARNVKKSRTQQHIHLCSASEIPRTFVTVADWQFLLDPVSIVMSGVIDWRLDCLSGIFRYAVTFKLFR
jgi:hypothetical protein